MAVQNERSSLVGSVIAGLILGGVAGVLLAGILTVVGGFLLVWNSFVGDSGGDVFRYLIVPAGTGLAIGASIGGTIGFFRARRRERERVSPPRPDAS